ncbi:MAG: GAF domain-containing sensor histidine kinase [Dehalococcoidia bacterium]
MLAFLFAIRGGTWAIALILVAFGDLPAVNTRHEPLLLALTAAQTLAAALYVPLLRPRIRRAIGPGWGPRDDLIALGLVDIAVVTLAVLYFSSGWRTPYYHYAVASLVVPAFLMGWRRSGLLLLAFMGAYMGIISVAGEGIDGPWLREDVSSLAGVLITPLLVVIVVQYMSWLARRLREQREQARRAFREAAAQRAIAQAVAAGDEPGQLVARVVDTLRGMERFRALAVFSLGSKGELSPEAGFGDWESSMAELHFPEVDEQALADLNGRIELEATGQPMVSTLAVPIHLQGRLWGVLAFTADAWQTRQLDLRLAQAVAGQLSLGLTKISLQHQKEELAAQEERSRIAREIHDGIAQSVYMLSLNLEKAAELASDDPKLGQRLGQLVALAKETLLEVRHYIFDLKPLLSGDASLSSTIKGQLREFTTVSGLPVHLEVAGEEPRLPLAVGSSLYRIAQEALANVYRHADATAIDMRLAFGENSVSLEIQDDGCGFAVDSTLPAPASGRGLQNICQRAADVGGRAEIRSFPGQGATVRVTLPIAK